MSPNDLLGTAALISITIIVIGAWTMRQRLGSRASKLFFLAVLALVAWIFASNIFTFLLFFYLGGEETSALLNYSVMTVEIFVPGLLLLVSAVCFVCAARTIPAPNSSFKPTPSARLN